MIIQETIHNEKNKCEKEEIMLEPRKNLNYIKTEIKKIIN